MMSRVENIEDIYELSPMQHALLYHTLIEPGAGMYFNQNVYTLAGTLEVAAFARAWQRLVARHAVLRTAFHWQELDKPLQVVYRQVTLPWQELDWRAFTPAEQQERLAAYLAADRQHGFDLNRAPLVRCTLIRQDEQTHRFVWSSSHLLFDGWSLPLIYQELFAFYEAFCRGDDLALEAPRPYRDYILWLQQQDFSKARDFWQRLLAGFSAPTPLGVDRTAGSWLPQTSGASGYAESAAQLSPTMSQALRTFARRHHLTLNTLLQGAWALLLSAYSGEQDVVFGVTLSGRPTDLPGAESMVGLFVNTLPMRVQLSPALPLLRLLESIQARQVEIQQYRYSPLVDVQGWSEVPRGTSLFQSILVFENRPNTTPQTEESRALSFFEEGFHERTNFPLVLMAIPADELYLKVIYDARRFGADTIDRTLQRLQSLLESMLAQPGQPLSDLSLLTRAEQQLLLEEWPRTQADYPDKCLHELFEAQVERTPDAVALVSAGQHVTYQALDRRANRLAHHLRDRGVGPETLVGIFLERSPEMVTGLLGVLKAGGAYVPLDPRYPKERLAFMLADTGLAVLLTQTSLCERLPVCAAQVICLDADWPIIARSPLSALHTRTDAANLAYVIYTSGSTGRPKGVQIQHRSVVRLMCAMSREPGLLQDDILLSVTTLSFDIATLDIFLPLAVGAQVLLIDQEVAVDGTQLDRLLFTSGATVMQATPATWRLLLEVGWLGNGRLKALCGGEALPRDLAEQLLECCSALWNGYGPTETTIYSALDRVQTGTGAVSIGRAIPNTQIYVLDASLRPVPIGVPGQLYIGGAGLARGYLHRSELTAERFIPNPFSHETGARLYATGDRACYLPDGRLEFLGRADQQLKIRGYRIEPGEIEAALVRHPRVREAVVVARSMGRAAEREPGDEQLVAYLLTEGEPAPTTSELRRALLDWLPDYMVPAAFVVLDAWPLTASGKINRRMLPAPEGTRPELEVAYTAPRGEIEHTIAAIWQEVLRVERVGIHDNFFDLGGHSLLLIQVYNKLRKALGDRVVLLDLFRYPNVALLSRHLSQGDGDSIAARQGEGRIERLAEGKDRFKQLFKRAAGVKAD